METETDRVAPMKRLALLLCLAAPAAHAEMTDAERQSFRDEVRAYLLDNPEVLMEAMSVLDQRQAQAEAETDKGLVKDNLAAISDDGASWVGGDPNGDVTLVEFMDYKCGYCRHAFNEVEDLVRSDGHIRFVLKEFPILGPQSELASRFAVAVRQTQDADTYKAVHDALMTMETDVTPESLTKLAGALGLDPAPILARMDSAEVTQAIQDGHDLAGKLQITGTPTFVLGGEMVRGYVPLDQMRQMVADERGAG